MAPKPAGHSGASFHVTRPIATFRDGRSDVSGLSDRLETAITNRHVSEWVIGTGRNPQGHHRRERSRAVPAVSGESGPRSARSRWRCGFRPGHGRPSAPGRPPGARRARSSARRAGGSAGRPRRRRDEAPARARLHMLVLPDGRRASCAKRETAAAALWRMTGCAGGSRVRRRQGRGRRVFIPAGPDRRPVGSSTPPPVRR